MIETVELLVENTTNPVPQYYHSRTAETMFLALCRGGRTPPILESLACSPLPVYRELAARQNRLAEVTWHARRCGGGTTKAL